MARVGRPAACTCGECRRCKHAAYMREWYRRKSLEERRAWISKRDPERVRANDRKRYRRDPEKRGEAASKWRRNNPELAAEAKRRWEANNPERVSAAKRRWAERNPEKRAAQIKVGNAIRDGRLFCEPCEVCGSVDVDAHHDDYNRPLDVRWLCRAHHAEHHKTLRQAA